MAGPEPIDLNGKCKFCGYSLRSHCRVGPSGVLYFYFCNASMKDKCPDAFTVHADSEGRCLVCGEELKEHWEYSEASFDIILRDKSTATKIRARAPGDIIPMLPTAFAPCKREFQPPITLPEGGLSWGPDRAE